MRQNAVCRGSSEGATASDEDEVKFQPAKDPLFGRFQLNEWFNADQVGLAFVNGLETTYDVARTKLVRVSQPLADLEKRQCTINICIGLGDKIIRPATIFPGKGRISAVERAAYDPRVEVFFQVSAWMDDATCIAWAKQSFLRSMMGDEEVVPSEQFFCLWTICTRRRRTSSSGPSLKHCTT